MLVNLEQLDPRPPPSVGTEAFRRSLMEVRERVRNATDQEKKVIALWADAMGTSTPSGHWNRVACQLARKHEVDERRTLETLALLNLALFDASIACWRVKYAYWLARPGQMDSEIRPLLKVPNFPSYPSGHSCLSAAAAVVLRHFYPSESDTLSALALEASESRIVSGIHYRFDCDEGNRIGRWVGQMATMLWRVRKEFNAERWL
jgi:hypothetical protein